MPMRGQRSKNSGGPLLKEEDTPNLSTKDFLSMPVNDAESLQSRQQSHILVVLVDVGPEHRRQNKKRVCSCLRWWLSPDMGAVGGRSSSPPDLRPGKNRTG